MSDPPVRAVALGAARTLRLYGFVGWVYVATIAALQPRHLGVPVTALFPPLHRDTFGAACFAVSFVASIVVALLSRARPGRTS